MANQKKGTPVRPVRVPDDIWDPAREKAERHGETISDVVRRKLTEYNTENET